VQRLGIDTDAGPGIILGAHVWLDLEFLIVNVLEIANPVLASI
jgi:hypothetical protein